MWDLDLVSLKYGIYREITNGYVLSSPHYQSFKESENKKIAIGLATQICQILFCCMCLMWLFTEVSHCQS